MQIEFELVRIVISETSDQQVIVLQEKDGLRSFPIIIGLFEAIAIDRKIKDVKIQRPMTHDLLVNVVERMGGALKKVVINDLQTNTFYAVLEVEIDGQTVQIDSRPSDAIAIAARAEVPIFVEEEVLNQAAHG